MPDRPWPRGGRRAAGGGVLDAVGQDAAVARLDEEILDAGRQELLAAAIHGIAFADAAQVQPHARLEEADRPRPGVEFDEMAADVPAGLCQSLGRQGRAGAAGEAPDLPERPGGNVIGPAGLAGTAAWRVRAGRTAAARLPPALGRRRVDPAHSLSAAKDRHLGLPIARPGRGHPGRPRCRGDIGRRGGRSQTRRPWRAAIPAPGTTRLPVIACLQQHVQRFQFDQFGQAGLGQLAAGDVAARLIELPIFSGGG